MLFRSGHRISAHGFSRCYGGRLLLGEYDMPQMSQSYRSSDKMRTVRPLGAHECFDDREYDLCGVFLLRRTARLPVLLLRFQWK